MGKSFTTYGKNETNGEPCLNPGGLTKLTSRSKEKIAIFIVPLIRTETLLICGYEIIEINITKAFVKRLVRDYRQPHIHSYG